MSLIERTSKFVVGAIALLLLIPILVIILGAMFGFVIDSGGFVFGFGQAVLAVMFLGILVVVGLMSLAGNLVEKFLPEQ